MDVVFAQFVTDLIVPEDVVPANMSEHYPADAVLFLRQAIVAVLQLAEWLTDRQAAEATQTRVDWKYVLHLSLNHIGFQPWELCLFRQQLLADSTAWRCFAAVVLSVRNLRLWPGLDGVFGRPERAFTSICHLNQVAWLEDGMAQALYALATSRPEWLRQNALAHWYTRYALHRSRHTMPPADESLNRAAGAIHSDIAYLLQALSDESTADLAELPEIQRLKRSLQQHVTVDRRRSSVGVRCSECALGLCIAHGCSGYG
jgi:transposase